MQILLIQQDIKSNRNVHLGVTDGKGNLHFPDQKKID